MYQFTEPHHKRSYTCIHVCISRIRTLLPSQRGSPAQSLDLLGISEHATAIALRFLHFQARQQFFRYPYIPIYEPQPGYIAMNTGIGSPAIVADNNPDTIAKRVHYSPPWADLSIIGIAGSSGSGKSTLSHAIVSKLNLPWVVILSMVSIVRQEE